MLQEIKPRSEARIMSVVIYAIRVGSSSSPSALLDQPETAGFVWLTVGAACYIPSASFYAFDSRFKSTGTRDRHLFVLAASGALCRHRLLRHLISGDAERRDS